MAEEAEATSRTKAWLIARSGSMAGMRYALHEGANSIGRASENDIVVQGPHSATVSAQHAAIESADGVWRIRDSSSTNGTFVDGQRTAEAELNVRSIIQLGNDGPEFSFVVEEVAPSELDSTLVIPEGVQLPPPPPAPAPQPDVHELLLRDAVSRARHARLEGRLDQTMSLMREVLQRALRRNTRRSRRVIWVLAAALVVVTALGILKIQRLNSDKAAIDGRIREIEARINQSQGSDETERLLSQLDEYEGEAQNLQRNLLYRVSGARKETFVMQEIHTIMSEFGAEVYSIPPEFLNAVNAHIEDYEGPDRPNMAYALNEAKPQIATIQRILKEEKLPPDFAYVPLVESAMSARHTSAAGAAGTWQFTPATARALGLRVDGAVDERKNLQKSTRAACTYLRQLILDFGTGSSVMLALAAYNLGPTKVKQTVLKVEDPFKQRNFWYLYRVRALPAETREFVPKVFAAIIIARNAERFGF